MREIPMGAQPTATTNPCARCGKPRETLEAVCAICGWAPPLRSEATQPVISDRPARELPRRITSLDIITTAWLLLTVVTVVPQLIANVPRMRWAQWVRLPLEVKFPLGFMWIGIFIVLIAGQFEIDRSSIVVKRKERPWLFWSFIISFAIWIAWATQVFMLFW